MSTILAYTSPAAGHTFPLVPGLLALQARGHAVRAVVHPDLVEPLTAAGLDAVPLDPRILDVRVADYEVRSDRERLAVGLGQLMARGPFEIEDLRGHLETSRPDVVLVDTLAYGGTVAAEASGLPWAVTLPSLLPLPEPGIPPYGLGLRPLRGPLGRLRDAALWRLVEKTYGRAMLPPVNELRASAGLPAHASPYDQLLAPDAVLVLAGEPLEYPRRRLPAKVHLLGAQTWDPPAERLDWLDEPGDPWVLVTCSTEYQADEELAEVTVRALRGEAVRVVVTLADAYDDTELPAADNVRVERFVPHGQVLERAAAVVCPGGMGITAKAVARGVPVVAVPFGRDQPEVARRVAEAGVGVRLPRQRLDPERLRAAVREARALPLRSAAPDETAGDRVARAVEGLLPRVSPAPPASRG